MLQKMNNQTVNTIVVILVCFLAIVAYWIFKPNSKCDLSNPINRDFKVYYGLEKGHIPFGIYNAEQNDAPFFKPIVKENFHISSAIFIGEFGSGKTHVRRYRLSNYDTEKTLITYLLSTKLDKYLDIYVNNAKKAIKDLNKNDFMQMILFEIVDNILTFDIDYNVKSKIKSLKFDEKVNLAYLMVFYSNNEKLDSLIKLLKSHLIPNLCGNLIFDCADSFDNCNIKDFGFAASIRTLLNDMHIISDNTKNRIVHLIYCIGTKTKLPFNFLGENSKKIHIKILAKFLNDVFKKRLVIVVDSLDENSYLFDKRSNPNITNLQTVINSLLDTELLSMGLGNADDVIFDILIFLPFIKDIQINWERKDKIPVIYIKWTPKMLENYADFVLNNLRKEQINYCKLLPITFSELLDNDDKLVDKIFQSNMIKHPRNFHIFMNIVLNKLNENASHKNEKSFLVSKKNVESSLEETRTEIYTPK